MEIADAQKFLAVNHRGCLVARKRDGWPQMTLVSPAIDAQGRVILTTKDMAKVQLITDTNCAVGALVERSRRQGVLRGDGGSATQLFDIASLADVTK